MTTTMSSRNVVDILEQLGMQVANVGTKEIAAHCPFHKDSHPSFSINAETGLWICYQCSSSGTLSMLITQVGNGANPVEVLRKLRHDRTRKKKEPEPEPEPAVDPFVLFAKYESFGRPPLWAIDDKKITEEASARYGLRWDHGWIIPIWSAEEMPDLLGWQFKRMEYVSNYPKAVKKSTTLFGYRELTSTTVVVVESPLDVVRLAAVGVAAVAPYGAYVSNKQLQLLIGCADRIILAFDNDDAGREQQDKIYPKLARKMPTTKAIFPHKDPGDLSDEEVREAFDVQRDTPSVPRRGRADDAGPPAHAPGPRHGIRKDG